MRARRTESTGPTPKPTAVAVKKALGLMRHREAQRRQAEHLEHKARTGRN